MSDARDDRSCVAAVQPVTQARGSCRARDGEDVAPGHERDYHGATFCVDRGGRLTWASRQAEQALHDLHHLAPGSPRRLRTQFAGALWRDVPSDRRLRRLAPEVLGVTGVARMTTDRRQLIVDLWCGVAPRVQIDPLWSALFTKLAQQT